MTTRTVNRGTLVLELDSCPSKTAGVLFQKCQQESMEALPRNLALSTKRGTSRMKVSEYPKVQAHIPNWGFISTCRGTACKKL